VVRLLVRLTVWITTEVCIVLDDCPPYGKGALEEELTIMADEIIPAISAARASARFLEVDKYASFQWVR